MDRTSRLVLAALATLLAAAPAQAQVGWTDWMTLGTNTVSGTMTFGSVPVGVTYSGTYSFVQTACGTNYWSPNTYTGTGVPNAPVNCEIIGLNAGGTRTITFSQAVTNPLLALVSWNGQPPITFNGPLQVVANGQGFWGSGSMSVNGNVLTMTGEAHGTVRLLGTYTSITFSDVTENWHGFQVGAEALGSQQPSVVPEPSVYALTATGLLGLLVAARRRRA